MHLTKHHGLGNDFLVAFVDGVPSNASTIALEICNRHTGIGADGLIFGIDDASVPTFNLFNSDGSPAEMSGNGMRCFVQAIAMRRGVTELELDVETLAGVRSCTLRPTDRPSQVLASVDMGQVLEGDKPDTDDFLSEIADLDEVRWATGSVGNPHVVIEVPEPQSVDVARLGPIIESHFPNGVNAHFIRTHGTDEIVLRSWERGAGVTQACGSGATVAAQRMHDWGMVGDTIRVQMSGGTATVEVATAERSTAVLAGHATFVGAVQVPHG